MAFAGCQRGSLTVAKPAGPLRDAQAKGIVGRDVTRQPDDLDGLVRQEVIRQLTLEDRIVRQEASKYVAGIQLKDIVAREVARQLAESASERDRTLTTTRFAEQALGHQRALGNIASLWRGWQQRNLPEMASGVGPRDEARDMDLEAVDMSENLRGEVKRVIGNIEQLEAPPDAVETKIRLLAEGDMLHQFFMDVTTYYVNDAKPDRLYYEANNFIFQAFYDIETPLRRELTDLLLGYAP